jgi:hypothetical protein
MGVFIFALILIGTLVFVIRKLYPKGNDDVTGKRLKNLLPTYLLLLLALLILIAFLISSL